MTKEHPEFWKPHFLQRIAYNFSACIVKQVIQKNNEIELMAVLLKYNIADI